MNSVKKILVAALTSALTLPVFSLSAAALTIDGTVVEANTKTPLADAFVTLGKSAVRTDKNGAFHIEGDGTELRARAYGHTRQLLTVDATNAKAPVTVKLEPFVPRGIYLSSYGISSLKLRNSALDLVRNTQINTFVIDIKTDSALVTHKTSIPLASEIGAQKLVLKKDLPDLIAKLHEQGIYTIGRIVTFKDTLLAQAHPELAIKTASGGIFRDNEGLAWVDPTKTEVWDYNVALAVEAAQMGFDEVQFDYVRFPDKRGLVFSKPNTEENRVAAINGLLTEARKKLEPYNVFLSADIFGYVSWNLNDTEIGQRIVDVMQHVDYASPMLYPSGFQFGIPGYRNPVANSHEIVYRTLERARVRANVDPVRFRPWLQAFKDYAFDRRQFGQEEIQQQVSAAERFGSNGWLLWNPRNVYAAANIKRAEPTVTAATEQASAMR
ncbi:MAG TPA: putative glycoside hydrolase [Spongiibacteraceae bacterium]|nr:putative glycoside hydrolase [Spongiibacteraceae bacterium]